jgi:hypothetical protein
MVERDKSTISWGYLIISILCAVIYICESYITPIFLETFTGLIKSDINEINYMC